MRKISNRLVSGASMLISVLRQTPSSQPTLQHSIVLSSLLLIMSSLQVAESGSDHCYADIGCFPLGPEFYHPRHRPINVRPWHRRRIKTKFELFNKHFPDDGFELEPWNKLNLISSRFNPKLETKIIVPGWLDNIKRALWVKKLKDSLLWLWKPVNIIVVYWKNFTPYTIATANTRVVGAELANLLHFIEREFNYDRAYFHLIGHSLGAHICGYCGDRVAGLGRITALDPARPYFQGMPKSVRLDRGDAKFVDAIHSDFTPENAILLLMSFGMTTPVGHVDFYPNGPRLLQPGCFRDTLLSIQKGIIRGLRHGSLSVAFMESTRYLLACDHQRSHEWFIESITNRQCLFVGVRCSDYEGMINGRCSCDDSQSACAIMGIHADQMYLNNAHKDLWPLRAKQRRQSHNQDHDDPTTAIGQQQHREKVLVSSGSQERDRIYSKLKQEALRMRQPSPPSLASSDNQQEDLFLGSFIRDFFLMSQLPEQAVELSPSMLHDSHSSKRKPVTASSMKRKSSISNLLDEHQQDNDHQANYIIDTNFHDKVGDDDDDNDNVEDDDGDDHFLKILLNGQEKPGFSSPTPSLLSDFDRDIETWYEDSSRWYLKTNHKPNYCVNQYQVLIFLGPLNVASNSKKRKGGKLGRTKIKANLILSIVGSRGQLINQRFVPNSADLDSFTMQPFFILLEGSYSLGKIMSVAVGWESRLDESASNAEGDDDDDGEDGDDALRDQQKATVSFQSNALDSLHQHLLGPDADTNFELKNILQHAWNPLSAATSIEHDYSDGFEWRPVRRQTTLKGTGSGPARQNRKFVQLQQFGSRYLTAANQTTSLLSNKRKPKLKRRGRRFESIQRQFESILLGGDYEDDEDTIEINKIVVNPLQANYGRSHFRKIGKTFCSPRKNYKLSKQQTVKLVPSLFGHCHHTLHD